MKERLLFNFGLRWFLLLLSDRILGFLLLFLRGSIVGFILLFYFFPIVSILVYPLILI